MKLPILIIIIFLFFAYFLLQYFKEKGIINAVLVSCLFIIELVIGCLISGDFTDRINYKEETALAKAESDENKEEIEVIKEENANPEVEDEEQNVVEPIDIESEIDKIRNMYNVFQNNKENYQPLEVNDKVTAYLDSNENVVFLVVQRGCDNIDFERWYLINHGELVFSFVYNGLNEHRLYFKNGVLFRYIDQDIIYDNVAGIEECEWKNTCQNESKEILSELSN